MKRQIQIWNICLPLTFDHNSTHDIAMLEPICDEIMAAAMTNTTVLNSLNVLYWHPDHWQLLPDHADLHDVSTMLRQCCELTVPSSPIS